MYIAYVFSPIHPRPMGFVFSDQNHARRQATACIHFACQELFIPQPHVPFQGTVYGVRRAAGSGWKWWEHLAQAQAFEPALDAGVAKLPPEVVNSITWNTKKEAHHTRLHLEPFRLHRWLNLRSKILLAFLASTDCKVSENKS